MSGPLTGIRVLDFGRAVVGRTSLRTRALRRGTCWSPLATWRKRFGMIWGDEVWKTCGVLFKMNRWHDYATALKIGRTWPEM
jgi:hypothetical protein